ncbi:MAG: hypothetical protein CL824_05995 [Crocinitomicaceae bacterium]|nr:hypothetical protein [Crocinitomicaceae bacterium]
MNFLKYSFVIAFSLLSTYHAQTFDGYALYNRQNNNNTYLIDKDGNIAHTWNCNVACNYTVLLKENGNIVRGGKYSNNQLNGAAIGGMVQEIDPNGSVVWEYVYSNSNHCQHHDICLIGDNVLLTAWEVKTANQVTAAGYSTNSDKWPTHFVELQPDGNGSASIVWEWHIWDHLIQDVDPNKPSYGNIADNPQLIDINMIQSQGGGPGGGPGGGGGDWFHVNGVDYNADLDQIAFSSRFASEIYVIDHSTSTAEAASHSGGNSGMGGDILYRWGNPSNYNTSGSQIIPDAVHDVRWIENDGRPNAGFLQVFNNEGAGNNQSTIDAIDATGSAGNGYTYNRTPGQAFEPTSYSWRYTCAYSAPGQSASNRMSNGNIFVNCSGGQGGAGIMYETDPTGNNIIWQYNGGGPAKAFRYECDYPGIITLLNNPCMVDLNNLADEKINIYPNPSNGLFTIYGLSSSLIKIKIIDAFGKIILESKQKEFDLSSYSSGLYNVIIEKESGELVIKKISLNK